ncbi:substrate-binding domain-containing protein [Pseudobacteroides cellulosolvens]|uniref:histidine kinase n=1 Tax=Pseudobacteroides cellulosolvens ATCC 35603 = DSM 2933 TaxID=398512 RepID=A0A0L6JI74_9FIRM|nr:substrate-binding domain-containing protein [Pseudobacteroides cellulosolvens]KNY25420.1 histidine kinase [Pseudobacteroides cellulosolvens ATCC 35603 = DSM 2933]
MNRKRLNIGVITKYVENFYFGSLLKGIQSIVKQKDARMVVFNTYMLDRFRSNEKEGGAYFPISFNHIDGWIILTEGISEEYKVKLLGKGKPVVLVGHRPNNYNCSVLLEDNFWGAKQVVEHLISHGHKRIAYLGCSNVYDITERFEGYKKTLEGYGLYDESIVFNTKEPMPNLGREVALSLAEKGIDFTAIFSANDYLAFGFIDGLREMNINVPEDIAVVGYDNTDKSKISKPALSSVNQDTYGKGIEAAKIIFRIIESKVLRSETILFKSDLVLRESCGCKLEQKTDENDIIQNIIGLKRSMIERLEDVLYKNSDLGTMFFSMNVNDIIKLIPEIVDEYTWFCFGLLDNDNEAADNLIIQTVVDNIKKSRSDNEFMCSLENFPPLELLTDYELDYDDVLWIVPVSTEKKNIGVMAYISKIYEETSFFAYDMHMVLFNLFGISVDRGLAMDKLKETLASLKKTQEQLIESEKLVSLGSLVAGVAHEINNPIGVSVTATTYMESNTAQLKELFETNKLTKSDLTRFLNKNNESVKILLMNLQRASDLIRSFKQIAVDNTIDEKRIFKVKDYVNDVILSLNPKLRKKRIKVNLECPEDLELHCNPGELSQILTNLILNSIIHGYDEEEHGEISILFKKHGTELIIEYNDFGKGMKKDVLEKIFEPFFTTQSGSDGSGLGLIIISNIIKQKFGGTIKCDSEYKKGTKFIISIPLSSVL